jgi:hypothetical protein
LPVVGAAALLASGPARAEPAAEPAVVSASLELVSPPGCGSEAELAGAIRARSDRIRIEKDPPEARELRVEIRESGAGLTTILSLTQPNGRRSTRTLRASSCTEALDAAALVAAVSLDPSASTAAVVEAPAPPKPPSPLPVCAPCERTAPEPPPPPPPHVEVSASVTFDAISGPAPDVMPGFGAAVLVAYERGSVLSPALRLSYSHFARGNFEVTGGTADFVLDAGTLELCPLRAEAGPVRVYPCLLRVTGGQLRASGSRTVAPVARARPWWELGASLAAYVYPSRSLELGLTVAFGWPLVRDTFQFEPLEFHRVSALALTGGLGAGVRFP